MGGVWFLKPSWRWQCNYMMNALGICSGRCVVVVIRHVFICLRSSPIQVWEYQCVFFSWPFLQGQNLHTFAFLACFWWCSVARTVTLRRKLEVFLTSHVHCILYKLGTSYVSHKLGLNNWSDMRTIFRVMLLRCRGTCSVKAPYHYYYCYYSYYCYFTTILYLSLKQL